MGNSACFRLLLPLAFNLLNLAKISFNQKIAQKGSAIGSINMGEFFNDISSFSERIKIKGNAKIMENRKVLNLGEVENCQENN